MGTSQVKKFQLKVLKLLLILLYLYFTYSNS